MTRKPVGLALLVGAVVLAAVVLVVGLRSDYRLLGSNRLPAAVLRPELDRSRTLCQQANVPAGTGGLGVVTSTAGRPRPALSVTIDGRPAGRTGPGREGPVRIPVRTLAATRLNARICVTAAGHEPISFGGYTASAQYNARDEHGHVLDAAARLEFLTPTRQSWWSTLGDTARRFGYGKAPWEGAWTLVLVGLLGLGALAAAAWALLGRDPE